MPPYQVLLFDFDGTLCATQDSILYSFQHTFTHYNVNPPAENEIMQAVSTGASLPELLPVLHPSLLNEEVSKWVQTYRHIYSTEAGKFTTLFDGTVQVLEDATTAGIQCVVISNKGQRAIEEALEHFHLARYFDLIIGDNPAQNLKKKPHPMAFQEIILQKYAMVQQGQFLMVGDTHVDLGFAQNARIDACWASYGYGDHGLCLQENPTHTIAHLTELLPIILPAQH